MSEPVTLYVGRTTHHRFAPRPHRFSYRLFQLLIDVDAQRFDGLTLLRRGPFGLFSYSDKDHGPRDGSPLRPWVEARLAEAGIAAQALTIRLLCFPRIVGFVFNPLSIFFVHGEDERLEAVIYEVNNTFGQTHAYVVPAEGCAVERHEADKALYVSPFYRVEGGYHFRLEPPGERLDLTIVKHGAAGPDFNARLLLERRLLSDAALLNLFFLMPLMTLGVVAAIHWEALRLLIKGAPFGPRAPGPKAGASRGRLTKRLEARRA
ncbi:DUF1365 domain-containing protein [Phenylobacterium montanum]|uniref:DUF1365 domain-containing protein n=1 Tax=Phenylobacterium montanum TaxID=2823693 RepID=A0A975G1M4_9CAUL|nr:DUF1365 domain-containing protein [Caulobacter sp. S6]QUD88944.1 DUF1365 domain-containing protein [Caulobacter sp. S6]